MDRMLVVVFDNETKAYEGKKALLQLDGEGSISVYAYAVLAKHADGTATVKQGDDSGPVGTLLGTSFGSLTGLLGGPVGLAIGATAGLAVGGAADLTTPASAEISSTTSPRRCCGKQLRLLPTCRLVGTDPNIAIWITSGQPTIHEIVSVLSNAGDFDHSC
jgi:hypothetical protein